ncbi:YwqG family protein [Listeria costaricensis]|uniref:YwqG family protein n=1 Tax=Listeria costaricensis TaxID=2026604 RepID=UPI000C077ED3|nr:YwqG family protein [Listeria costaricensis]
MNQTAEDIAMRLSAEDRACFLASKKPILHFTLQEKKELPLASSKVGGFGYLPKSFVYPSDSETGEPLSLLAQINFQEMPHLTGFPEKGLLAFYINYYDDLNGWDSNKPTRQRGFRVLYFEDTQAVSYTEAEQAAVFSNFGSEPEYPVVYGEMQLSGQLVEQYLVDRNTQFDASYKEQATCVLLGELDEKEIKQVFGMGSHCGGYPFFTQYDPRYTNDLKVYDQLLFQLDSIIFKGIEAEVMWGDMGVGNFFIKPEDLAARKFDDVLFSWDCC